MIHKIVKAASREIKEYDVPEMEAYEIFYCMGLMNSCRKAKDAMVDLNEHLEQHYRLREPKPPMEQPQAVPFCYEGGIIDHSTYDYE